MNRSLVIGGVVVIGIGAIVGAYTKSVTVVGITVSTSHPYINFMAPLMVIGGVIVVIGLIQPKKQ